MVDGGICYIIDVKLLGWESEQTKFVSGLGVEINFYYEIIYG
jgi:hypothetical protein